MARPWFYRILEVPWVYNLSQAILAPGARGREERLIADLDEGVRDLALDFGCGPRLTTPFNARRIVGVDVNPDYVRRYTGGWIDVEPAAWEQAPQRSRFGYVCTTPRLPFVDGTFDEARCLRVMHHLTPAQVTNAIVEMARCLRPGGRLLLIDIIHPRSVRRRPLAWALTHLDRGEHVRAGDAFAALVKASCRGDWSVRRYTSTLLGVESLLLIWRKPNAGLPVGDADRGGAATLRAATLRAVI